MSLILAIILFAGIYAHGTKAVSGSDDNNAVRKKALGEIILAKKNLFTAPESSFEAAGRAKKLADNLNDVTLQGRATLLMGISLYLSYRFDEAINYLIKANKYFLQSNNIKGQVNVLKYQAIIQSDQGLYLKAIPYFDLAINLSKKLNNDTITVDLAILNGYVHIFNADLKNGFRNIDYAYQIARISKKPNLIARTSLAIGDWYNADGNFRFAIDFYHKAATTCDSINDRGGYIWAMNKLGMLFAAWQRYPDALDYLRIALNKSDDIHLSVGSGLTHRNLGEVYICMGEYQEALKNYTASYKIEKAVGNRAGMAESMCGEAEVLLNDKQFTLVKSLLDSIKPLLNGNFDPSTHAIISRINGLYDLNTENYAGARVQLLTAIKLAKNYDQTRLRLTAINNLKTVYEREKNYPEAYRYTLQYIALNDSIYNTRLNSQLVEKRMVYRSDEMKQKIESLSTVNKEDLTIVKNHNQIVFKQRLLMFLGLLGSFIFSGLLIMIIMHQRVIKNVNRLLDERNEQLIIQKELINEVIENAKLSEKQHSAFLVNMSHEIRKPMNEIMRFSGLLSMNEVNEQFIDHIDSNSEVLLNLMDNMIDIVQIETGQFSITFASCRVDVLLLDLEETFLLRLNTYKKREDISLVLKMPLELRDLELYTDRMKLYRIFSNLLDNAIKFTDSGSIEFGIEKKESNTLYFYVKDTGVGIKPENKEIIFNRFRPIEDSFTRRFAGPGIGLSITRSIIELLGGKISVESVPDMGSIFRFSHPVREIMFNNTKLKKSRKILRDYRIGIKEARAHSYYFKKPV